MNFTESLRQLLENEWQRTATSKYRMFVDDRMLEAILALFLSLPALQEEQTTIDEYDTSVRQKLREQLKRELTGIESVPQPETTADDNASGVSRPPEPSGIIRPELGSDNFVNGGSKIRKY